MHANPSIIDHRATTFVLSFSLLLSFVPTEAQKASDANALIRDVIRTTVPLIAPRGDRLPLYIWPARDLGTVDESEISMLMQQLDARGIAVIARWNPNDKAQMDQALSLARIQRQLNLPIAVDATSCTYSFFNGDPRTAHIDTKGEAFFDDSFGVGHKMGCPFAIDFRLEKMRQRIQTPVRAYKEAGLDLHFIFADWEIDGPIEWNGAWAHSKRCSRCREHIPDIDDFSAFQAALRRKRSQLQKDMLAQPVLEHFPEALVGNYGVYPDDGYRYWFDYFEKFVVGAPHKTDARARYRRWFPEFALTGYSFAMPVVYTWDYLFNWYEFANTDYRWFYNMLLIGSNAAQHTAEEVPIVPFVHWHTIALQTTGQTEVRQFSEDNYRELLWHLLLRGHDTFFMWSPQQEGLKESQLVQQVYAASHAYRNFLANGQVVTFAVPPQPGPVVSALRLGTQLLVRRTDFDDRETPVLLQVDGQTIDVHRLKGHCQVFELQQSR